MDEFDQVEAGRRLGHDYHRWTRLPMKADWPASVREGFGEAAARHGRRTDGDRFHRKWLQLRSSAWQRQRPVADDVTPGLLRELDVSHCPVTREPLTHGLLADTDWSVDRLNNDGAYAAGNLAVMSVRANRAKGSRSFEEVLALHEAARADDVLSPAQWLRLAALMLGPAYATHQHLAPVLPLVAPLPCRSVRLAMQQIQRLFTLGAGRHAGKNALVKALLPAASSEQAKLRLHALADAIHEGLKQLAADGACWDVWLQPRAMAALLRWRDALTDADWALAARIGGRLAGGQRVTRSSLQPWLLPTRGYVPGVAALPM